MSSPAQLLLVRRLLKTHQIVRPPLQNTEKYGRNCNPGATRILPAGVPDEAQIARVPELARQSREWVCGMKTETPTTTNAGALECLRVIPPGKKGERRGSCASCGLHLWSEGGYRIPGIQGLFCSLLCMECAIAEKTGQTKKIPGAPIGNGARLLAYLKTEAPQVYAKLTAAMPMSSRKSCLECGVPLDHKQSGARFCSNVHRMRFRKKSA